MNYPAAAGYNQVPNGQFAPHIWSGNMLANYYEVAMCMDICNTDFEGEISDIGSKVIIRRDPEVEIYQYYKGMKLETQAVEDEGIEFPIEKGIYYNFPVDDVERRQSDIPWVEKVTSNASIKNKLWIDKQMLSTVYADVPAANIIADAVVNKASAVDFIADVGVKMDEAFIPDDGQRWIIVPHWMKGEIKKNPDFLSAEKMGDDTSILRNGILGTLDRMKVYSTSLLAKPGAYDIVLAGHPQAITFATQFVKTEKLRNPNAFGDLVRGLQVYDFMVTQPSLLIKAGIKIV